MNQETLISYLVTGKRSTKGRCEELGYYKRYRRQDSGENRKRGREEKVECLLRNGQLKVRIGKSSREQLFGRENEIKREKIVIKMAATYTIPTFIICVSLLVISCLQ